MTPKPSLWPALCLHVLLSACSLANEPKQVSLAEAGPPIEVLVEALSQRGVPRTQIQLGRFPLLHDQAKAGETLPLLSSPCPPQLSPDQALNSLTPALLQVGYRLISSERAWRPGRPIFAGVSYDGRPALALRLFPSGPRLSVIMSPPPSDQVPPRLLRRLPDQLTFALDLNAPGVMATYDYLSASGRELILNSSPNDWLNRGVTASLQRDERLDLAARWRAQLSQLTTYPQLSGVKLPTQALLFQDVPYIEALADELTATRVTVIEPVEGLPQLARSVLQARGVRRVKLTHSLSDELETLLEELRGVEAALVLEGHATLWVPPLRQDAWRALTAWLTEVTLHKGVWLLRASEIAL